MTAHKSKDLPVMEHFFTIQGEGYYSGTAAYFIRLGGCDVGCVWCDVKESWDAAAHPTMSIDDLSQLAKQSACEMVVITGGEPLMHPLDGLCAALHDNGLTTNVETSGAHPHSGQWDWICLSPKKFKAPLEEWYPLADELKIIIYNQSDFAWAEAHAAQVGIDCQLFLQPEWDRQDEMLPLIIEYVKSNPQWRISLQTHKFMDIP